MRQASSGVRVGDARVAKPPAKAVDPFYLTPEYRRWRAIVIARANGKCQWPGCGVAEPRMYADHIVERRDGGAPLDPANGQCLCARHHGVKTGQARLARWNAPLVDIAHPPGLAPAVVPLTIVCGPPASGKTTYVGKRAKPGELILDLDATVLQLSGGNDPHDWDRQWLEPALRQRNDKLALLGRDPVPWPAAWLIVVEPLASWRQWWADRLRPQAIVVLETPDTVCLQRLRLRGGPRRADMSEGVAAWWNSYSRRAADIVVRPGAGGANAGRG